MLFIILGLYLLLDTGYTFIQHYNRAFDGDLIPIVLPIETYEEVLTDPFGIDILFKKESYAGSNRYFVHWFLTSYFKSVPLALQSILNPVESVYIAAAISKTLCHLLLIVTLGFLVSGARSIFNRAFIIAVALITPLFQSGGHFYKYMGIVDQSMTYSAFYAWPMFLLLLFLKPYFDILLKRTKSVSWIGVLGMVVLVLVLPFSGPLIPGVILVIFALYSFFIVEQYLKVRKIDLSLGLPRAMIFLFGGLLILSLYSLYLGQYNAEAGGSQFVSIADRYQRLPLGLFYMLTQKLALPLLILMIAVNVWLIRRFQIRQKEMMTILKWMLLFAFLYLLLLPLGGTREYRPNILRKDTFLPVIISLVFYYGYSTFYIIKNKGLPNRVFYLTGIILFSLIFTYADEGDFDHDDCERRQIQALVESNETTVQLSEDCTVFSWLPVRDSIDTKAHSKMFEYWNITEAPKQFYQPIDQ